MPGRGTRGSRCCVTACSNYQLHSPGVVFHRFPRDSARRKVWVDTVCQWNSGKPLSPTHRTLICSDHFLPECYIRDRRFLAKAGFSTKYARLELDAVPSIPPARMAPKTTADRLCVKYYQWDGSTASAGDGLPTGATHDGTTDKDTAEHGSLLDEPMAEEEPVGIYQDQAASAPGCNSSTATTCDILSADAPSDCNSQQDLEPPMGQMCLHMLTRG
ncbi:unnamed protein product, partial [Ixodes hexagonus]